MKSVSLLLAFALASTTLFALPTALAIDDPPECIRQGPPCGPEPICVVGDESNCLATAAMPCAVGGRECLVGIEWVVCVTEPCPPLTVCLLEGRICRSF